ncbi:lactobin A/cerein 7B family class IIb bacteriocin [uncultured Bacteroides sp.]|uniref:lactobin A/cerein 7B family class IIb bacteriocin n=1 Tax=uncultured Bacteroides sp. TaxID=162156 RepID=UPI0025D85D60|nr:lactobin A/cerein 7B family class IIb bacteriocin [uncultured Bacteroides sp.]
MKNFKENAMMQEMNLQEMKEVNGGFDVGLALAIISAGIYIYNEGGDFIEGFKETFNK